MSFTKTSSLLAVAALIARVSAHGIVQGIVAEGVYYSGYSPSFAYQNPPPTVAGWSIPEDSDNGFVSDYSSPDIVCHKGATPGGAYVTVAAGDTVELQWTIWPESHKGPIMDYLASCNGDCTTVDKTALLFSKIDEAGLINGSPAPGTWASDTMIANNNSWTVTIPSDIAAGKYVLRHETIALHSAENLDGSQAYPQCVNLEITGSGTKTLSTGTIAQAFYKDTDPGILVNIYYPPLTNYTIPGPALLANAVSATKPAVSGSATATATAAHTSGTAPVSVSGAATSKIAVPTSAVYSMATTATASPTDTKPVNHPSAISSTSSSKSVASSPSFTPVAPATTSSAAAAPTHPVPMSSVAAPTETTTSKIAVHTSTAYGVATMTTASPTDTKPFNHPSAISSTSSSKSVASSPSFTPVAPATTSSAAAAPTHPVPISSVGAPSKTSTSTRTLPMSFTSTFTGRIGKPTKFTCYVDED